MRKFLKNSIKKNLTGLFCSLFPSEVGSCWVLLPFVQVMLGFSFVGIIIAAGSMTLTRLLLFCGTTKLCRKSIPRLPLAFLGWWNAPSFTLIWKQHTEKKKLILILTSFEMCSDINNILAYYLPNKLQNFFQLLDDDCVCFRMISCYIMNVII